MPKHVAVPGSERVPLPGSRVIGLANFRTPIEVSIKLRRKRKLPDLKSRPRTLMSRRAFAAKYGASSRDVGKLVNAFASYGLKKVGTNLATRTVRLQGTVAQLEAAFQTKLFKYAYASGPYRGRVWSDLRTERAQKYRASCVRPRQSSRRTAAPVPGARCASHRRGIKERHLVHPGPTGCPV